MISSKCFPVYRFPAPPAIAVAVPVATFAPWKMNHACLGNVDAHVHWHLIPRYESEADHRNHPWVHAGEFAKYNITALDAREIATRIAAHL